MINFKSEIFLNQRYFYLYIFFFALAIRIITIMLIPLQTWEYETIATNVLNGRGFIYPHFGGTIYWSYCEPLYPFVCIVVYFLTHHSIFALELLQAIFSSAIAVVIYFCARSLYGQKIALLVSILVALHPGLIIYTTKLHPLTLDALLISLVLVTMIKLFNNLTWRNIVIAGLVSGLCILTRPTILVFLPLALIYIFKIRKTKFAKSTGYLFVFLIVAGVVFLPWTLRNYFTQGQFMLTRSNVPYVLWLGNNPNFSGSAMDRSGRSIFKLSPSDFQEKIKTLDELAQNREFLRASFSYIKRYPLGFIERTIKKFYYFWWFNPQAGLLYPKVWFILYKIYYLFVLIGGITGIFFSYKAGIFKYKGAVALIVLILLSISLTQSLFYIETRHRWAVEPLFLIFTAKGIYSLFSMVRLFTLKVAR